MRIFDDNDSTTPNIGLPLGVRVTSRDGSAIGKQLPTLCLTNYTLLTALPAGSRVIQDPPNDFALY